MATIDVGVEGDTPVFVASCWDYATIVPGCQRHRDRLDKAVSDTPAACVLETRDAGQRCPTGDEVEWGCDYLLSPAAANVAALTAAVESGTEPQCGWRGHAPAKQLSSVSRWIRRPSAEPTRRSSKPFVLRWECQNTGFDTYDGVACGYASGGASAEGATGFCPSRRGGKAGSRHRRGARPMPRSVGEPLAGTPAPPDLPRPATGTDPSRTPASFSPAAISSAKPTARAA
jgi:hypothetical protein